MSNNNNDHWLPPDPVAYVIYKTFRLYEYTFGFDLGSEGYTSKYLYTLNYSEPGEIMVTDRIFDDLILPPIDGLYALPIRDQTEQEYL